MTTLIVLLRGINLGRRNRIAMADLRKLLSEMGFEGVRTHLQSGNAIVATDEQPETAARAIERRIEAELGHDVDVIVRTPEELAAVVEGDPFAEARPDPARQFVVFLDGAPDREAIEALAAQDFSPDRFVAGERELHVLCPEGMQDSKLMKALTDKKIRATATVRNWRTVTKLHELVSA